MTVDDMKALLDDRQIYVSSRLWHEIYPKVDLTPFIFILHEDIDLSKYGEGIKKFYFTFIIVRPDDKINLPYTHYSKNKKEVDIAIEIPYEKALEASKVELIQLMEEAYLKGIDKLKTLPVKERFDVDKFKKDVENIFSIDKWYEMAQFA
jgi:hypothetical protein